MNPADPALVQAARAGDRAAFGALAERHRPMLMRLVSRVLNEPGDAEDVAQEACLQAYLSLARLRTPERFGAWLAGIGLNLARHRLRQCQALCLPEDSDGGRVPHGLSWAGVASGPSAEVMAEARQLQADVLAAVASLPAKQQAAVRLFYWEGLTITEVGAVTHAPPGTVKARLHRARRRLQTALADYVEASPAWTGVQEASMIEVTVEDVVITNPKPGRDAVEATSPGAAPGAEMVRRPLPPGSVKARVVLLKERAGERILPIWVGPFEADSIAMLRAGATTPRPMTFELIAKLMETGNVELERVTISRLAENTYYASLSVRAGGATHEVDARPSDAVALALRLGVAILVDPAIMDQQGLAPDSLTATVGETWQSVDGEAVFRPPPMTP
jgi:RNA polymerase sigma factor (sigma-70 family)